MLSTRDAFDKFRKRLELSDTEQKDAARRHADLRECVRSGFDIKNDFLSGSYRRHTKTKPLKDVDVVFVLGDRETWRRAKPPIEMLQAFEACLETKYTDKGPGGNRAPVCQR
jgi:Second Messenger Oligonucleotide or Dinucleotide Synthetase domain